MALKPEELDKEVELNDEERAILKSIEKEVDIKLLAEGKRRNGYEIGIHRKNRIPDILMRAVERLYEKAGWKVKMTMNEHVQMEYSDFGYTVALKPLK